MSHSMLVNENIDVLRNWQLSWRSLGALGEISRKKLEDFVWNKSYSSARILEHSGKKLKGTRAFGQLESSTTKFQYLCPF